MPVIDRMVEAVQEIIDVALGVNLLDMIIQIAATLILVVIVKYFFWGKITDFLDKRKNIMDQEMESAKNELIEAKTLKEKRETEYNELKIKSKGYLDSAKEKAEQEHLRIVEKAKEISDQMMERAKKEIEAERIKAEASLQKETVDLAALMAEKIIRKEVDETKYQDMLVDDLERSGKS
ncbi:MAG: F0F1 ATP synthase subunit B [Candidatus Izemoplasmatales bacterium]|nr:F0F1 ATP synthase subunit B [Candidatus Izemoplasmatales bacterium]